MQANTSLQKLSSPILLLSQPEETGRSSFSAHIWLFVCVALSASHFFHASPFESLDDAIIGAVIAFTVLEF